MNIDKAKKRISKLVKKGFDGYPLISIEYFGETSGSATKVVISFVAEENAEPQKQAFSSDTDARNDEAIQSTLVKIIERSDVRTVVEVEGVSK